MTEGIVKQVVMGALLVSLLVMLTWIVVSPTTSDEITKTALALIGSVVGYVIGRFQGSDGSKGA